MTSYKVLGGDYHLSGVLKKVQESYIDICGETLQTQGVVGREIPRENLPVSPL